jgi:hypothetical protein
MRISHSLRTGQHE